MGYIFLVFSLSFERTPARRDWDLNPEKSPEWQSGILTVRPSRLDSICNRLGWWLQTVLECLCRTVLGAPSRRLAPLSLGRQPSMIATTPTRQEGFWAPESEFESESVPLCTVEILAFHTVWQGTMIDRTTPFGQECLEMEFNHRLYISILEGLYSNNSKNVLSLTR